MFGDVAFAQAPFSAAGFVGPLDAAVAESGAITDSLNAGNIFVSSLSESSSGLESVDTFNNILNAANSEAAEVVSDVAVQTDFAALVAEVVAAESAQTVIATMLASVNETGSVSDDLSVSTTKLAEVLEAASAQHISQATVVFLGIIFEAGAGLDDVNQGDVFSVTVAEAAAVVDSLAAFRSISVFPEGVQIFVQLGTTLVWATLNNSQIPDWQIVSVSQEPNFVTPDTASTPNFINVVVSQTPNFVEPDTASTPNWVSVPV